MDTVFIDCGPILEPQGLHDALSHAFSFPDYYGKNLDALYDCLTDIEEPTRLILLQFNDLAPWAHGFRAVFQDAIEANPLLQITMA